MGAINQTAINAPLCEGSGSWRLADVLAEEPGELHRVHCWPVPDTNLETAEQQTS
jgi:hypothetical protein